MTTKDCGESLLSIVEIGEIQGPVCGAAYLDMIGEVIEIMPNGRMKWTARPNKRLSMCGE